jgi:hypothetical protein
LTAKQARNEKETGSAATLPEPNSTHKGTRKMKSTSLSQNVKSAEEAIAEMEKDAIHNRYTYMKVDAWILTDNNFDSVNGVLYIEPDLGVNRTQVVGDSISEVK